MFPDEQDSIVKLPVYNHILVHEQANLLREYLHTGLLITIT